jgi:hypothetical protein
LERAGFLDLRRGLDIADGVVVVVKAFDMRDHGIVRDNFLNMPELK